MLPFPNSDRRCQKCNEYYNEGFNTPLVLPCYHNICKYCIVDAQSQLPPIIICRLCNSSFSAKVQFQYNLKILEVIKKIDSFQDSSQPTDLSLQNQMTKLSMSPNSFRLSQPTYSQQNPNILPIGYSQMYPKSSFESPKQNIISYQSYSEHKERESFTKKFIKENINYVGQPISQTSQKNNLIQLPEGHANKCSRNGCNAPKLIKEGYVFPYCCIACSKKNEEQFKEIPDKQMSKCSRYNCYGPRLMKGGVEFPYCSYACSKNNEEIFSGVCGH